MDIGKRIKNIRNRKGLSTYDLSKISGISQSTISKLENGKRKADTIIIQKLADALEVSPDRLTGESASSIIENRLEELGITLEYVAEKSGVSLYWLQNIDTFIPGQSEAYEIGYSWITKVAEAIGLPGSTLRAALARQEIPAYDGPIVTAKEAFKQAQEDFKVPYVESNTTIQENDKHYYLNDETREIAQEVFENPDLRSLFHVARDIDPDELRAHIDFMKRLRAKEKNDDYER